MPKATDGRLCWLAVRDQVRKRSRKKGPVGWVIAIMTGMSALSSWAGRTGVATGRDSLADDRNDKMGDYGFAVEDAAAALSREERTHLRATGEVPDWFLADVQRRYEEMRKKR